MNAPGSDSVNPFETAAELACIKPLWAVIDNSTYSAAYLLATAAQGIYVPDFAGGAAQSSNYAILKRCTRSTRSASRVMAR